MIHETIFTGATLVLALLVLPCIVLILRSRSISSRIIALDTLVLVVIAMLVMWADAEDDPFFLDAALLLALLGFIGSLAAARFHGRGRLF